MNTTDKALRKAARRLDEELIANWRSQFVTQMEGESWNDAVNRSREELVVYRACNDLLFGMALKVSPDLSPDVLCELEENMQTVRDMLSDILESCPVIRTMDARLSEQTRFEAELGMADAMHRRAARQASEVVKHLAAQIGGDYDD